MPDHIEAAFSNIYKTNAWGTDGNGSGQGSSLEAAAGASRILYHVLMHLDIRRVADCPCGGMLWQTSLLRMLAVAKPKLRFLGVDVVSSVVEANRRITPPLHNARFIHSDLAATPLPRGFFLPRDAASASSTAFAAGTRSLIFSRDALQHNSLHDVWRILANFARSDATHLLLGSYPKSTSGRPACASPTGSAANVKYWPRNCSGNIDVPSGGYFDIDLAQPPFALRPVRTYLEGTPDGKALYLISMATLRHRLAHRDGTAMGTADEPAPRQRRRAMSPRGRQHQTQQARQPPTPQPHANVRLSWVHDLWGGQAHGALLG